MRQPVIRALTDADLGAVSKLHEHVFAEPPWNENWSGSKSVDRIAQLYNLPERIALASSEGDRIVGVLIGTREPDHKLLRIRELFVDSQFRRRGHGSALIRELAAMLSRLQCAGMTVITKPDTPACRFYRHHGFEVIGKPGQRENRVTVRRSVKAHGRPTDEK